MFHYLNPLAARLMFAALLVSVGTAANADDTRYYLGAGVSAGEFSGSYCSALTINCDQEIGFQLFGGYQFNRHAALQAGYGNMPIWNSSNPPAQPEISTLYLAGIGRIPFGGAFALTGRLGAHRWDGCDTPPVDPGVLNPQTGETDNAMTDLTVCPQSSGTGILFGVGAEYDFYEHLRGQLNWTRYGDAGNGSVSALSFNLVALF